jgi:RNA polymerase-interacting CarD/CdnL/TRCF family regulator
MVVELCRRQNINKRHLRKIVEKEEVARKFRILQSQEHHKLNFSSEVFRMIKLRSLRETGNVVRLYRCYVYVKLYGFSISFLA